jgi:hypothetical protein
MFLQAGLVASRKAEFWDYWIEWNNEAHKYLCAENDTLNLMAYSDERVKDWKLKIFDKDKDYYGCKALAREHECVFEGDGLKIRGEKLIVYHNAKGRSFPKLDYKALGFNEQTQGYLNYLSDFGVTARYASI